MKKDDLRIIRCKFVAGAQRISAPCRIFMRFTIVRTKFLCAGLKETIFPPGFTPAFIFVIPAKAGTGMTKRMTKRKARRNDEAQ
jgi:hypothetical protein